MQPQPWTPKLAKWYKSFMLPLILTLAIVLIGSAVILAVATRWAQGYFYETTVEGLSWRSVAAAAAVTAFFGLWAFVERKSPGKFDSLFQFSAREEKQFDRFWSERQGPAGTQEILFRRRASTGNNEYFDEANRPWRRADANGIVTAIIVEEDGDKKRFKAKLGPDGKFLLDMGKQVAEVQYIEEGSRKRAMREYTIGRLSRTRFGPVLLNLLFNLTFLGIWFAILWFLLEFQMAHALFFGAIFWLFSVTLLWPVIQAKVAAIG